VSLRALASVNLAAIERNVTRLRELAGPGTRLCAVVKADAYGHGAVPCARAALRAGAEALAVATAREAVELRSGGVQAPVLVLGALSDEELPQALAAGAEVIAWSLRFVEQVERGADAPVAMHVKLDTGMGRLGTRALEEALAVADRIAAGGPRLALAGAMTHFASADEDPEFVRAQLDEFEPFVARLRRRAPGIVVHCANSAAIINEPATHFGMVRPGIAMYGGDPMNEEPSRHGLEPALALTSYVAAVKLAAPGQSTGYGRRYIARTDTWLATLPIGYADGIRRAMGGNGQVLVGGTRYPIVGAVSMDNVVLEIGAEPSVAVGERATLVGTDGAERLTAEELARRMGTVNYEVLCGISARVPRAYHRDGEPV